MMSCYFYKSVAYWQLFSYSLDKCTSAQEWSCHLGAFLMPVLLGWHLHIIWNLSDYDWIKQLHGLWYNEYHYFNRNEKFKTQNWYTVKSLQNLLLSWPPVRAHWFLFSSVFCIFSYFYTNFNILCLKSLSQRHTKHQAKKTCPVCVAKFAYQ